MTVMAPNAAAAPGSHIMWLDVFIYRINPPIISSSSPALGGLNSLADILILFTNRQSILHHPVLCDSSHTMRYIWANSAGSCFSTPWCLAKRSYENTMQNTEIWLDCSPDSMITATFLPSFMWAGGCKTSICCYLCFCPRWIKNEGGRKR